MASSSTSPTTGPALFHAAIARHRETWAHISRPAYPFTPVNSLAALCSDSAVASSPDQSPADPETVPTNNTPASAFTTSASSCDRGSLFSAVADDTLSHTSGDGSSYTTARSSTSMSAEEFDITPNLSRRDSVFSISFGASAGDFPILPNLTRRDSVSSRSTSASTEEFPMRPTPARRDFDLGSDDPALAATALAENRRIFAEGFNRMAAHQVELEALAQTIRVEQTRARAGVVGLQERRVALQCRRPATEREAMLMLIESVPFSAEGRGQCEEAEVRRVARNGVRWSLISDSPYPRFGY